MAFNSLDKKFSPDFAIPKVPPVGETLLDQSCSITRGITLLVAGGALGKNKAIGGSDAVTTKATRRGPYLEFDGTSDTLRFDNVYTSADIASTGITQLVRFRILGGVFPATSDSLTQGTTTISNNPPAGGITFNVGGNVQLTGRIYNGSAYVDVAAPSGKFLDQLPGGLYQWLTVAIVADPVADTFTLWQQGDPADQTTSAGLSGASFSADKFFLASQYDLNSYPNVEVQLCAAWNRALSDAEMVSLNRDPFQLLKPATKTGYFTPSGAAITSALTGTATAAITETDITDGGKTIIVTLTGDTFKAAGTGPIGSTADTQAFIDGFDAAASPTNGWNNEVRDKALTSEVVRTSSTIATWTISAQAGYDISAQETITGTIPIDVLVTGAGAITSTPTFTIDAVASGRIMGSLAGHGGLAGIGGLAGGRGGMAG